MRVLLCSHMGPMRVIRAILQGQTDSRAMMAQTLANGQIHEFQMDEVPWPAFLD